MYTPLLSFRLCISASVLKLLYCRYFAHLAQMSDISADFIPPTVSQIRQVNLQLRSGQLVAASTLLELCKGTGIHEGTLQKVQQCS